MAPTGSQSNILHPAGGHRQARIKFRGCGQYFWPQAPRVHPVQYSQDQKDVRLRSRRKSAMMQKGRPRPLPPLCAYAQWRKKRKYTPLSVPAEHAQWRGGVAARTLLLGLVSRVPPISNSSYLTGSEAVQPTKTVNAVPLGDSWGHGEARRERANSGVRKNGERALRSGSGRNLPDIGAGLMGDWQTRNQCAREGKANEAGPCSWTGVVFWNNS